MFLYHMRSQNGQDYESLREKGWTFCKILRCARPDPSEATSSSLAEVCPWPTAYLSEQHSFWQDCFFKDFAEFLYLRKHNFI